MEYTNTITTQNNMSIPQVATELTCEDQFGAIKARWGIGRMSYIIEPGLYALGTPDADSPVLVTANYKMSFDKLREQLAGRSLWIMVIDTDGINVWCAAGKGTFGTDEIVNRIEKTNLAQVVNHKTIIVPQLGAPGVSAHKVKERSGFRVIYGPIRATDASAFLDSGNKATPGMRKVTFDTWSRLVLIPVELVLAGKYALITAAVFFLLSGLSRSGYSIQFALTNGTQNALVLIGALITAPAIGAICLPYLPGRAFAIKGLWVSFAQLAVLFFIRSHIPAVFANWASIAAWLLMIPAVSSFMVMNFTGTTTFTSLSGVMREMKYAVPIQIAAAIAGIALWITSLFITGA